MFGSVFTRMCAILAGRKRRGSQPSKFVRASSSVCRHVLQTLEKLNIVEEDTDNG